MKTLTIFTIFACISIYWMLNIDFSNIQSRTYAINEVAQYTNLIKTTTPEQVARQHEHCDNILSVWDDKCLQMYNK